MHFISTFTTFLAVASALPTTSIFSRDTAAASVWSSKNLHILSLGASITYGTDSSDGNGYRLNLRNSLSPAAVTYIGTQCGGSMSNANNEGHPGWMIPQMQAVAAPNMAQKPNVVLVYVGTNDMKYGNAAQAPQNMHSLVSYLTSSLPGSLIVISKLFLNVDSATQARIETFNAQISTMSFSGNVVVADFSNALLSTDLADGTHPNDGGYVKMATVFASVLATAESQGRIPKPASFPALPSSCNGPAPVPSAEAANDQNAKPPVTSSTTTTTTSTGTSSTASTSASSVTASTISASSSSSTSTSSTSGFSSGSSSGTPSASSSSSNSPSGSSSATPSSTTSMSPIASAINKPLPSSSASSAATLSSATHFLAAGLTSLVCSSLFLF